MLLHKNCAFKTKFTVQLNAYGTSIKIMIFVAEFFETAIKQESIFIKFPKTSPVQ